MLTIKKDKKFSNLISGIVISLISLLFFLSLGELICRLKYKPQKIESNDIFEYDKDKIYKLKKNTNGYFAGKPFSTNSLGMRDYEILIEKPVDTIRILALGDSVTFGHGVTLNETFAKQLEKQLSKKIKTPSFNVINAGTPGNSTFQEYYDLKKLLKLKPDIIILQFTLNDIGEKYQFTRYGGENVLDYHKVEDMFFLHRFLIQRSAFYLFYKDIVNNIRFGFSCKEDKKKKEIKDEIYKAKNLVYKFDDPKIEKAWRENSKWMQKIVDLCKKEQIDLVLLVSPFKFQLYLSESLDYPQKKLESFSRENDVSYLDLLPLIRKEIKEGDDKGWYNYFLDDDHYNPNGHSYVSDLLYNKVVEILNDDGM